MVGPSLSEAERDQRLRAIKTGFVLVVGFSGGLVALSGDASLELIVVSIAGGLVVGMGLVWYLGRISPW
jgi:cyanate permease